MKIIVVSGGFDPIHSGHIEYLASAKELGSKLIVALNSDKWLIKKKNRFFMPFSERKTILENLSMVDEVIGFEDDDKGSCINALNKIKKTYYQDDILFCNGGDRNKNNIPEMNLPGIQCVFGVGGEIKKNSSSWILKNYLYNFEEKIWGKFYTLFNDEKIKLKELLVLPNKGMSYQRHFKRSEILFVSKGSCLIHYSKKKKDEFQKILLKKNEVFHVKKEEWHQIINPFKDICHIIEIQYGDQISEDDIERDHYYLEEDITNV